MKLESVMGKDKEYEQFKKSVIIGVVWFFIGFLLMGFNGYESRKIQKGKCQRCYMHCPVGDK